MPKSKTSKAIEEQRGAVEAPSIAEPLVYIDNGSTRTLKSWGKLKTEDAKRAFFNKMFNQMDDNFSSNWQAVYELIALARDSEWYWREQGFDTFEEFWTKRGEFSFEQFRDLEQAHLFAAMVEPELFNVDAEEAIATAKKLAGVRAAKGYVAGPGRGQKGLPKIKKTANLFDGPSPTDMNEAVDAYDQAAKTAGKSGSNSILYRFGRLKRDAPGIAAKVLRGEYTRKQKNGKLKVDLIQAEKDAGLWKEPEKKPSVKRTPGERAVDTLNDMSIAELRTLVDRMNGRLKRNLNKVLSEWILRKV